MSFTSAEKAAVLKQLGYPDWRALAQSIQLGFPASSQPMFLVQDAFNRISPDGESAVREALCELEDIDRQQSDARKRLKVGAVGELRMNPEELSALRRERSYWQARLADSLGVGVNPYSVANGGSVFGDGSGGLNRRVVG